MAKAVAAVSISGLASQVAKQGDSGKIEEGGDRDSVQDLSKIGLSGKEVILRVAGYGLWILRLTI